MRGLGLVFFMEFMTCLHNRISKNNAKELYALYFKQHVDIKPFFDWIGSTNSGYELFLKERFKSSYKKITNKTNKEIGMENYFNSGYFKDQCYSVMKNFIVYQKGI